MKVFIVLHFSCKPHPRSVLYSAFSPHSAAKEMAIILNLQHAKDDIEIIFILFLLKLCEQHLSTYHVKLLAFSGY